MRRYYLLFDSKDECREAVDVLESTGLSEFRLHAIGGIAQRLDGLPKANVWQRTELAKGIVTGLLFGGAAGFCGGMLVVKFPPPGLELGMSTVILMSGLGALFGLLVNALTKSQEHNRRLDRFRRDLEKGRILLLADLPTSRSDALFAAVREQCPGVQVIT